jgi:hypothetical protein
MSLSELVRDEKGTKLSSSRVWFNIANTAATAVFLFASYKASLAAVVNLEGLAWYTLSYMGIVTGNKFANKFLGAKYGTSTNPTKE